LEFAELLADSNKGFVFIYLQCTADKCLASIITNRLHFRDANTSLSGEE